MKKYCRNCFYPLPKKAKFCTQCGQKDTDGKTSMRDLLLKFWDTTFHLQGKFVRTAWHTLSPGFVASEYFKGKQKRYLHPVQFFLIVMVFFLFFLQHDANLITPVNPIGIRQIIQHPEEVKGKLEILTALQKNAAALSTDPSNATAQVDSMLVFTERQQGMDSLKYDSISVGMLHYLPGIVKPIATSDALLMSDDSLLDYYQIKHPISRMMITRGLKSAKETNQMGKFFWASISWLLLAIITLLSWVLQRLFRDPPRFYVEHFVLLMLHHAGGFFIFTLGLLLEQLFSARIGAGEWAVAWMLYGSLVAFIKYYGGVWLIVFLKWLVFVLAYLIIGTLVMSLSLQISLLTF